MTCLRCKALIERHAERLMRRLLSLHPSEEVVMWMPGAMR